MKYLEENKMYMNPFTGSVSPGEEWEQDYEDWKKEHAGFEEYEDFGIELLIEVEKIDGEWREVK